MRRRTFLEAAVAGATQALATGADQTQPVRPDPCRYRVLTHLAGLSLTELRRRFHSDLSGKLLPFWNEHGIDHEYGGVLHGLDYDGTRVHTTKLAWFQGRAVWVYSFLYNHFGRNLAHLEIARATKDFLLKNAPQPDGWWAESFSREGRVLQPFSGDIYGMYFAAEGLQEYAWAAADDEARKVAFDLVKKLFRHIDSPGFRFMGTGAPGVRPQGLWMVNVNCARQMVSRWKDPEIDRILKHAVDMIVHRHYNPEIGLNNEDLNYDFSRTKEGASKCVVGHSIESLWMVMEEALRRGDRRLWDTCAARIHRHLDVGWDRVFGGLPEQVNVDQGGYVWPPERPVGTDLVFHFTGEFQYMKTLWALNETLVATLNVLEQTGAAWAAQYFDMAQRLIDEKFAMTKRGLPGYGLFGDRRMNFAPHTARQDNYHPLRQLMLNLLALERMIKRGGRPLRG